MFKNFYITMVVALSCSVQVMKSCSVEQVYNPYKEGLSIVDVFQSEAAFTHAADKRPIVATSGCATCVAVGGYDGVNKMAFVVHFATPQEVLQCGKKIIDMIRLLSLQKLTPQTPLVIHLRGGEKRRSENTIAYLKLWMKSWSDVPMTLGSEDTLCYKPEGSSLLIDSRSGFVADYDPTLNPHARIITEDDIQQVELSFRVPCVRVIYAARNHNN